MGKAIALATPLFFLLIAIELLAARARGSAARTGSTTPSTA